MLLPNSKATHHCHQWQQTLCTLFVLLKSTGKFWTQVRKTNHLFPGPLTTRLPFTFPFPEVCWGLKLRVESIVMKREGKRRASYRCLCETPAPKKMSYIQRWFNELKIAHSLVWLQCYPHFPGSKAHWLDWDLLLSKSDWAVENDPHFPGSKPNWLDWDLFLSTNGLGYWRWSILSWE